MTAAVDIETVDDAAWIEDSFCRHWDGATIVSRGRVHQAADLSGFRAMDAAGALRGLASYAVDGEAFELVTLDSFGEGAGTGTALVSRVLFEAWERGCRRVWLVITNDNTHALRFYQKRGARLVAVYPNALAASRELKPTTPEHGHHGIPIRDEIELEWSL